ncbi:DUF1003 domain-containing protein [Paenibacillus ihuae]|uniref:DUF1003 domain-containing protein n=1 Tax=Paenibacillus ihuae TaxID=1232431 RepID=UPI0006D571E6|nr:DUF1003 domain-containing protein [Paenibacillus ihuae]
MKSKRSMNSDYDHTANSELLLKELEKYPNRKPNEDDIKRVASMVNEYKGSIKAHLLEQQEQKVRQGERFADWVAKFGGSWLFVINFCLIVIVWLAYDSSRNSLFILSFCLSVFTVFQAAMIQMSQNRQAIQDKQEQLLHIAINYKAEKENLEMQEKLHKIDNQLQAIENHLTSLRNPKFF